MIRFVYNDNVDNTIICLNKDGDIVLNVDKQSTLDLFYACFKDMGFADQDKLIDDIMKTEAYKRVMFGIIKKQMLETTKTLDEKIAMGFKKYLDFNNKDKIKEKDLPEYPVSKEPVEKDVDLKESKIFHSYCPKCGEKKSVKKDSFFWNKEKQIRYEKFWFECSCGNKWYIKL